MLCGRGSLNLIFAALSQSTVSEPVNQSDSLRPAVGGTQYFYCLRTDMAGALLRMQRRQAKDQLIRWKQDLRHLAAEEVSTAL